MTAPFGIAFHSPVEALQISNPLDSRTFEVVPPQPHPLFDHYIVRASSTLGVVWIKALGPVVENDRWGTQVRETVERLKQQLAPRYGEPVKSDFLLQGSIWTEPEDWSSAVSSGERIYSYLWERPRATQLPQELGTIFLGAADGEFGQTRVVLEYASINLPLLKVEEEREMANLL